MDGELLSRLGPWGVVLALGIGALVVVWKARAAQRHHIELDVTIRYDSSEDEP